MSAAGIQIEQALRQMNAEWVTALLQRDAATLRRIMAQDCTFTYPLEGDGTVQHLSQNPFAGQQGGPNLLGQR